MDVNIVSDACKERICAAAQRNKKTFCNTLRLLSHLVQRLRYSLRNQIHLSNYTFHGRLGFRQPFTQLVDFDIS